MSSGHAIVWVLDTSSIVQVRRSVENSQKSAVFDQMGALVEDGRLVFPKQVVTELERVVDQHSPDAQYLWTKKHETKACETEPSLESVKAILAVVPKVLDPDKDTG